MPLINMKNELSNIFTLYHLFNMLFSLAFPIMKMVPPISNLLFGESKVGLDAREHEILIFLVIIIAWKSRKATNILHALSVIYLFSKLANAILFLRLRPIFGIIYSTLAFALYVLVPEPIPAESSKIHYFQGEELRATLEQDKSIVWIIQFYSTWSPNCRYMALVFNELGEKFSLPNLRFGKLDVGKYSKEGEHFQVNSSAASRQLPTIACFKGGIQVERRPLVGQNRRAIPFVFNEENIILALDLNNLYVECNNRMKKWK